MRIRHFNIAGVAWSNFETGFNVNGCIAISNYSPCIDVVNVSAGVNVAIVALRGRGCYLGTEARDYASMGCGAR